MKSRHTLVMTFLMYNLWVYAEADGRARSLFVGREVGFNDTWDDSHWGCILTVSIHS